MERPEWSKWEEDALDTLTDEQVELVMEYWRWRGNCHRAAADALPEKDIDGKHRERWSAWNCSKWESKSYRVLIRRGRIAPQ